MALDLDKNMRMEVDTSDYMMREILLMKYADRRQRLLVYLSKLLNKIKQNYEIHDKEILVIIRGLKS